MVRLALIGIGNQMILQTEYQADKMGTFDNKNTTTKRQIILHAAIECFSTIGLQQTSIKDICDRSGLRSGSIYYYFKSKDDIIEAAFLIGLDNVLERIEHMLEGDNIIESITKIHREAESIRRKWHISPGLRLEFKAETARNERLRLIYKDWFERIMATKRKAAERAIAEGRLDPRFDPASFARAMALIWNGLNFLRVNSDLDIPAYEQTIAKLLQPWILEHGPEVQQSS